MGAAHARRRVLRDPRRPRRHDGEGAARDLRRHADVRRLHRVPLAVERSTRSWCSRTAGPTCAGSSSRSRSPSPRRAGRSSTSSASSTLIERRLRGGARGRRARASSAARSRASVDRAGSWRGSTGRCRRACRRAGCTRRIGYMVHMWPGLVLFLDNPRIPLDNNGTERAARGPVLGRKNHYGSRSLRGTEVAATLYSLVESAKLNEPGAALLPPRRRPRRATPRDRATSARGQGDARPRQDRTGRLRQPTEGIVDAALAAATAAAREAVAEPSNRATSSA